MVERLGMGTLGLWCALGLESGTGCVELVICLNLLRQKCEDRRSGGIINTQTGGFSKRVSAGISCGHKFHPRWSKLCLLKKLNACNDIKGKATVALQATQDQTQNVNMVSNHSQIRQPSPHHFDCVQNLKMLFHQECSQPLQQMCETSRGSPSCQPATASIRMVFVSGFFFEFKTALECCFARNASVQFRLTRSVLKENYRLLGVSLFVRGGSVLKYRGT